MKMSHDSNGGGKPLPMAVHNVGFLLDRLGKDCSPLQYLRELTQNAIEAVILRVHGFDKSFPATAEEVNAPD
jgi:hypothetical protein